MFIITGKIEILSLLPARRRKIKMETDNAEELSYVNNDESSSFYSENDEQYSDDDFGSECSCSTCSTCSTCELCEEELAEEEFGDSSDEEMRHNVPRCEPNLQFCNSDSDNTEKKIHALNNELQRTTKNGYKTDEQYIIEKVTNVVVLKADASQFQNGGYITGKGKTQELLLGGKQRKKRVTFFDSSSSSDVQAEAFSISSLSDSSTSGCCADFNQHLQNGDNFDHKTISSDPVKEHSNDLSEGDLDREYHRLKSVLKTIDPSKLLGVLKHSLKLKTWKPSTPWELYFPRTSLPLTLFTVFAVTKSMTLTLAEKDALSTTLRKTFGKFLKILKELPSSAACVRVYSLCKEPVTIGQALRVKRTVGYALKVSIRPTLMKLVTSPLAQHSVVKTKVVSNFTFSGVHSNDAKLFLCHIIKNPTSRFSIFGISRKCRIKEGYFIVYNNTALHN